MSTFRKGLWLHHLGPFQTPDAVREMVHRVRDWGFDLLIPCVKMYDGWADYHSKIALVRPGWEEFDPLMVLAEEANALGLEVHPWSCVFVESTDPQGSALLQAHPEARGVKLTDDGPEFKNWACPSHEAVRDYNVAICEELLANYPVAGVHLDYIRNGGFSVPLGCQCEVCRAAFREMTGEELTMAAFPGISQSAQNYVPLSRWRAAQVTEVVRRVHEAAAVREQVVSAAVFSNFPVCYFDQGQDWVGWADQGIIDHLFPMTYIALPEVVKWSTESYVAMVKGQVPLWPGLCYYHDCLSVEIMTDQVQLAKEAGADGVVIFEYTGMSEEFAKAIQAF